jgi:hypothetical protein
VSQCHVYPARNPTAAYFVSDDGTPYSAGISNFYFPSSKQQNIYNQKTQHSVGFFIIKKKHFFIWYYYSRKLVLKIQAGKEQGTRLTTIFDRFLCL